MRNFTPQGLLKVTGTGGSGSSGSSDSSMGALLAAGFITPLGASADGLAASQALSAAEDSDGIAVAQAPVATTEMALEPAAAALTPPRYLTLTSIADLSAINFAVTGSDGNADAQSEVVAGPAGAPQDDDGIALDQAPAAATPMSLEPVAASLAPARQLTLTSSGDLSGVNFEIVGFDEQGDPQTVPAFVGPNNDTVTTSERWSVVTSITPDAADANTLTVGWPDTAATILSAGAYSVVASIIPDGTSGSNVEIGWPDSTQPFALQLTLNDLDPPRRVTLSSSDNLSGITFQVSGTDAEGALATQDLVGPDNGTVTSAQRFATVTSIVPLSLGTGSVSVGWPDELYSLYKASDAVEISHLYARNNNAVMQTVDCTLVVDGVEIPWLTFDLDQDEVAALFGDGSALPLNAGNEIRVTSNTPGAVSFTLHGRTQA